MRRARALDVDGRGIDAERALGRGARAAEDSASTGTQAFAVRFALRHATLAPSSHNSQPWRFVVGDDRIIGEGARERTINLVTRIARSVAI